MLVTWRALALISMSTVLGGCDLVLQLERPPEAQRFITFVQVNAEVPGDATSVAVTFDAAQTEGNFIVREDVAAFRSF